MSTLILLQTTTGNNSKNIEKSKSTDCDINNVTAMVKNNKTVLLTAWKHVNGCLLQWGVLTRGEWEGCRVKSATQQRCSCWTHH